MSEPDQVLELRTGAGGWARCGLWWSPAAGVRPPLDAQPGLGRLGRLEASGPESAAALLAQACAQLRWHGCSAVLAPLDGDTWHPYRLLEPGQDSAGSFAGEPDPDPRWMAWLAGAGFVVRERYVSSLCSDLHKRRSTLPPPCALQLVPVESLAIDDHLEPIHQLILNGFRHQPLFLPLSLDAFRLSWAHWCRRFDPHLSLIAFDGEAPVGLLLAHPDGPEGCRVVVRTLVVQPGRRWAGLGRRLLESLHRRAADLGFPAVIHALMHDPGPSLALSRHYASPFRRYVLMGRSLGVAASSAEVPLPARAVPLRSP